MNNFKKYLPQGVQDYLGAECYNKRAIEQTIRQRLLHGGFIEVESPSFEYYDVFASGIGSVKQESMLKFFDSAGHILVLRPDLTMPIARICATKLSVELPQNLFYIGDAYGCDDAYYSSQKEFTQAGVEMIGISGHEADALLIATAIDLLKTCGLKNFQIDMGQVEFFKGLMEEAGLDGREVEALRSLVDQKNSLAVEMFLKRSGIGGDVKKHILALSSLYGGVEVLEEAQGYSDYPRCRAALDNLRAVHGMLCSFGLGDYLTIDLGMLQSIDYYSGIVFKGISSDLGQSLLSGGRYDNLLAEFGLDAAATGFALGLKRLLIALERQDALAPLPGIDVVISAASDCRREGYARLLALKDEGVRVEAAFQLSKAELDEYAQKRGAKALFVEGVCK